jgi:hypothetical protein
VTVPRTFSLDDEVTAPAFFSALLLAACAAVSVVLALRRVATLASVGLALLFAGMALDEALGVHEHLEWRAETDWQTLYAPAVVGAGVVWLLLVRELHRRGFPYTSLVGGAVLWGASQLIEKLQRNEAEERVASYDFLVVVEEVWEMAGSALFLLGLVLATVLVRERGAADA